MTTGERIKDRMEYLGFGVAELSRKSGVGYNALSKYTRGVIKVSMENLEKIAAALDYDADSLIGEDGESSYGTKNGNRPKKTTAEKPVASVAVAEEKPNRRGIDQLIEILHESSVAFDNECRETLLDVIRTCAGFSAEDLKKVHGIVNVLKEHAV